MSGIKFDLKILRRCLYSNNNNSGCRARFLLGLAGNKVATYWSKMVLVY